MSVAAVSLVVPDVPEAAGFLARTFGWRTTDLVDEFAEVETGSLKVWLSRTAPVPSPPVTGLPSAIVQGPAGLLVDLCAPTAARP